MRDRLSRDRVAYIGADLKQAHELVAEREATDGIVVSLAAHPGAYAGMRFTEAHYHPDLELTNLSPNADEILDIVNRSLAKNV